MLDLLLLATMMLACGGIGLPIANLLPSRFRWRLLIAPTLGLCALAVAAPVLYQIGVPILGFFIGVCAVAAAILAASLRRAIRAAEVLDRRLALLVLGTWIATTLLLLAPRWAGGDQFAVFQGNHWDTYGYLESAVVYARKPYSTLVNATDKDYLANPLYPVARGNLEARPSVHLLYATFSRIAPGHAYRLYYPFLVCFFAQFGLVAMFFLRNALPNAPPIAWLVPAVAFPLGFWGQYVFDINAWSQISAIPTLFLFFALVIHAAVVPDRDGSRVRVPIVIGVAVAGSLYLYPEAFTVYAAAVVPIGVAIPLLAMIRARRFSLRPFVPLTGLLGVATGVLYPPTFHFIVAQIAGSGVKVPWWQFFQVFFLGRDGVAGDGADRVVDFVAGIFGLYFVTPSADASDATSCAQRIAIVVIVIAVLASLGLLFSGRAKLRGELPAESRSVIRSWGLVSLLLLVPAALLALQENYWPAGKAVSYAAPVFVTLLCVPIAYGFAHRVLRPLRWIAVVFVAIQIGAGVVRIPAATSQDGIHYDAPYPAIGNPGLKKDFGWDLSELETLIPGDARVYIGIWDPWVDAQLQVFLFSRKNRYVKVVPVNTSVGASGREVGTMPASWTPDIQIGVEQDAYVVHLPDGRLVRVPFR
jgi:hypothetical protein